MEPVITSSDSGDWKPDRPRQRVMLAIMAAPEGGER